MKLLNNEHIIQTQYSNAITLTNYRIRHISTQGGTLNLTSLLVENIQSVSMQYRSRPLALLVGLFLIAASFIFSNGQGGVIALGAVIGGALIVYYLYTRKHYLIIATAGRHINVLIKGQSSEKLIGLIDLIEETASLRKEELMGEKPLVIS